MPLKYHNKHTYLFVYCLVFTKETGEQTLSNLGSKVFSMHSSARHRPDPQSTLALESYG